MSTVTRPRGPLPSRVYWTRRILVLGVVLGLVFALVRLLGAGGGPGPATARPAAAVAGAAGRSSAAPSPTPSAPSASGTARGGRNSAARQGTAAPLAVPAGPCAASDVQVTPSVDDTAYAGQKVRITLNLTTRESAACTWTVSSRSVVLKLTSGSDRIWSTQDCPATIEKRSVVLRQGSVTKTNVTWNGQRSDAACSHTTSWAEPGYYHAQAAAFGSEPVDEQFHLLQPVAPTIVASPSPTPGKRKTD